jgi:hypothetical protein
MTASELISEFGHRFRVGSTDKGSAEEIRRQFRELGYRCRVSDVSVNPLMCREYSIAWWFPSRNRSR